jgi:hypothetical protein
LIDFAKAEQMQRYFKIANTKESEMWYDAWRAEKAKNEALTKTIEAGSHVAD